MAIHEGLPSSEPSRELQEQAASATRTAVIGVVIEVCGGIDVISQNELASKIIQQNLAEFSIVLGRPIDEVEPPGVMAEIPTFYGMDEQDSTGIIPKLQTASLLYTEAVSNGWDPWQLREMAEQTFAHLDYQDWQDSGLNTALIHYEKQWSNEEPIFNQQRERLTNEGGAP
jgi:hypothetical protein